MNPNTSVISAKISKDMASYMVAGDGVNLVAAEVGDLPVVTKMSTGDVAFGVVLFNQQKAKRVALDVVEIGHKGAIVTMVAATAISRGDKVAYSSSTGYVSTTSGTKIGQALDIASATGDIIRVFIDPA